MKKLSVAFGLIISLFLFMPVVLQAGGDLDTGTGLNEIVIPLFSSSLFGFAENASIISWLAFAGGLFTVIILAYWIFRILVSGIQALRSEGDPVKLQESYGKLKSNFIGMFITFLIPLVLSLIGAFLGIGTIFQWPTSFQLCEDSEYRFYFEAYIVAGNEEDAKNLCNIN